MPAVGLVRKEVALWSLGSVILESSPWERRRWSLILELVGWWRSIIEVLLGRRRSDELFFSRWGSVEILFPWRRSDKLFFSWWRSVEVTVIWWGSIKVLLSWGWPIEVLFTWGRSVLEIWTEILMLGVIIIISEVPLF